MFSRFQALGGLIPTYAGNTTALAYPAQGIRAHPHVCGEHKFLRVQVPRYWGSSPRMRGTLREVIPIGQISGLIPTYAGNTARPAAVGSDY